MENKLDNLFRYKLANLKETPTPQAWEQIHRKLSSKRRALLLKRLSIAASILLIATVGIFGYQSLLDIDANQNEQVVSSKSKSTSTNGEELGSTNNETIENTVSEKRRKFDGDEKLDATEISSDPRGQTIPNTKSDIAESAEILTSKYESLITESNLDEALFIIVPTNLDEQQISEEIESGVNEQNEKSSSESDEEFTNDEMDNSGKKKSYPIIKIIYKADQDSKLVASSKQTILDKGINRITEFSDEHLLTAERKTKLRNTKDDLLALNFGKLLNKSNKEVEN